VTRHYHVMRHKYQSLLINAIFLKLRHQFETDAETVYRSLPSGIETFGEVAEGSNESASRFFDRSRETGPVVLHGLFLLSI
jgi:hypothetical protein